MSWFPSAPPALRARRGLVSTTAATTAAALLTVAAARTADAQTDFYNTDAGRPITVEDAYAIERRAVEFQIAPLRLSRARGGIYQWAVEPEVAVGLLPRTQFEVALPLAYVDAGIRGHTSGLAGVKLSALHNLNVETSIPALGVAADVLLPAGGLGPEQAYASLKGIATKTFTWARFHVNGQYTFGDRLASEASPASGTPGAPGSAGVGDPGAQELSQWLAGVAVDRTYPLRSLLVSGEVYARQPLQVGEDVEWNTGAGVRYQLSPRVAGDVGAGYRLTGPEKGWYATFGAAVAVGLPWRTR